MMRNSEIEHPNEEGTEGKKSSIGVRWQWRSGWCGKVRGRRSPWKYALGVALGKQGSETRISYINDH